MQLLSLVVKSKVYSSEIMISLASFFILFIRIKTHLINTKIRVLSLYNNIKKKKKLKYSRIIFSKIHPKRGI